MQIKIIANHNCSAQKLWDVNTDWQYFEKFTSDFVRFESLPIGKMYEGQEVTIQSMAKNARKFMEWYIRFEILNPKEMMFQTNEFGGPIKSWKHVAQIVETKDGAQLIDTIDINAGLLTPIYAIWAKGYYKGRIAPRQKIIDELQ